MRDFAQTWLDAFREHRLLTYATAMAMRAFIGFIALTFLAVAVMSAAGQESIWNGHIAPTLEPKLTHATFEAVNTAVEKVVASNSTGLIAFRVGIRRLADVRCDSRGDGRAQRDRRVRGEQVDAGEVSDLDRARDRRDGPDRLRAVRRLRVGQAARGTRRRRPLADRGPALAGRSDLPRRRGRPRRALRSRRTSRQALGVLSASP